MELTNKSLPSGIAPLFSSSEKARAELNMVMRSISWRQFSSLAKCRTSSGEWAALEEKIGVVLGGRRRRIEVADVYAGHGISDGTRIEIMGIDDDKDAGDRAIAHGRDKILAYGRQKGQGIFRAFVDGRHIELTGVDKLLCLLVDERLDVIELLRPEHDLFKVIAPVLDLLLKDVDGILVELRADAAYDKDADQHDDL